MKNMVLLIDTNVLIDYLGTRQPYFMDAKRILELCISEEATGYVALHSISNIFFILRKECCISKRRELLKNLCTMITVTGVSHERVVAAIERDDFTDFEDCLQDECAMEVSADFIVTRNVEDFKKSRIKAITPQELIEMSDI